MSPYREQIVSAILPLAIHPPTGYRWFGVASPSLPRRVQALLSPRASRDHLLHRLKNRLYESFYCFGRAVPMDPDAGSRAAVPVDHGFCAALSEANRGTGCWENGWEVLRSGGDYIVLQRDDFRVGAQLGDVRGLGDGGQPAGRVQLSFPKELHAMSPGFYMAVGNEPWPSHAPIDLIRVYWNATPEGALHLMRWATTRFNDERVPFRVKALSNPSGYGRCDAVVFYTLRSDYPTVARLLAPALPQVTRHLRPGVPAFTKPLLPGCGLAEDPRNGESFGLNRCLVVAEGLVRAQEEGRTSLSERMAAVERSFEANGLRIDEPYLNPASRDTYPAWSAAGRAGRRSAENAARRRVDPYSPAEAARAIALHLVREAVWHEQQCTWIGPSPEKGAHIGSESPPFRSLGPEIYDGTSGIALFLAECHARRPDPALLRTALAAARHTAARLDSVGSGSAPGFYAGWSGIAWALARAGSLLRDDSLLESAGRLVSRFADSRCPREAFDLLSGRAGAIPPLLALRVWLRQRKARDAATRMGDHIVRAATRGPWGACWKSRKDRRALTGLSHGAAGVGYALLELYRATGDARYLRTGIDAFRYEAHWYDSEAANWPDFRFVSGGLSRKAKYPASVSWCHGAPGIALSRIRAYELTADQGLLQEAVAALETTARSVEGDLGQGTGAFSLCHGLTGNCEILWEGHRILGNRTQHWKRLRGRAIDSIVDVARAHTAKGRGSHLGEMGPGLMLGLAGIGYFCLRLTDPGLPSLLILRSEELARITGTDGRILRPSRRRSVAG